MWGERLGAILPCVCAAKRRVFKTNDSRSRSATSDCYGCSALHTLKLLLLILTERERELSAKWRRQSVMEKAEVKMQLTWTWSPFHLEIKIKGGIMPKASDREY